MGMLPFLGAKRGILPPKTNTKYLILDFGFGFTKAEVLLILLTFEKSQISFMFKNLDELFGFPCSLPMREYYLQVLLCIIIIPNLVVSKSSILLPQRNSFLSECSGAGLKYYRIRNNNTNFSLSL